MTPDLLAPLPFLSRRSPLIVAAASLAACGEDAPVACGDIPEQLVYVRETAELQPCFEDPEGEELVLSALSSDPEVATVLVYGLKVAVRGESVGSATITVTASDPGGLMVSTEIAVVVPNRAPVESGALPPAKVLGTGKWLARIDGSFEDPDGHALTFSAAAANTAVATAGIADSVTLVVSGVSPGTTTVTVTATDPWGLKGTRDVEAEVVEPVLIFRHDFDSSASLDDWTNLDASSSSVDDGRLRLHGTIYRDASAAEWELKAAVSNDDSVFTGFMIENVRQPPAYSLWIRSSESEDANYQFAACCPWETELDWHGRSDAIADVGEFTEVTLATVGGRLTVMAGSTLLVTVDLIARDWTDRMHRLRLVAARLNYRFPHYGFYDRVELNAVEADPDSGPYGFGLPEAEPGSGFALPHFEIRRQ